MPPIVVVLLGVSGSGKTSVGGLLATAIQGDFFDADDFHPPENVAKMRRGESLNDRDRQPWIEAITHAILSRESAARPAVFTCSGLKSEYRRVLRVGPHVRLFLLDSSREELKRRLESRKGHFFPASLLDSQLAALEFPTVGEDVEVVNADRPIAEVAESILAKIEPAVSKSRQTDETQSAS